MFQTGVLILTLPLPALQRNVQHLLIGASKLVKSTLYVHLQPKIALPLKPSSLFSQIPATNDIQNLMLEFYSNSSRVCSHLDVRVLLGNVSNSNSFEYETPYKLCNKCEVVLFDQDFSSEQNIEDSGSLIKILRSRFDHLGSAESEIQVRYLDIGYEEGCPVADVEQQKSLEDHDHVVLGGTFDRLHIGHKVLLGESCLLANQSITVGVTDGNMLAKKTLQELIEPVDQRIQRVVDFITEVRPSISQVVVPIYDMFGPSTVDPKLTCIVTSQETEKGGQKVNEERKKKGMSTLHNHVVSLLEDSKHNQFEENKISSSSGRKRLLGTLLHSLPPRPNLPKKPYIIGLTGGIASGKSSVCKRLQGLGAAVIDCDKLGHQAYVKGTTAYHKIVKEFGSDILQENGEVDRHKLGPIVFSDKSKLGTLNEIVWPEILMIAQKKIEENFGADQEVVILDAAVLLEAGWDNDCHEVWTTILPKEEAIQRLADRNKMSTEDAEKRLASQMTNEERVRQANVVLCTLWEYEYTQMQVEQAWELLRKRL